MLVLVIGLLTLMMLRWALVVFMMWRFGTAPGF